MENFRLWMLAAILTLCGTMSALAQINPKVTEILRKSEQAMTSPKGVELTMTMDVRMLVKLSGSTLTIATKGDKVKEKVDVKVMGQEMTYETGFDGTQRWKYKHMNVKSKDKGLKGDTLTIEKTTTKPKSDHGIDFGLDKTYKKATMKLNGRYYELTFTDPVDKEAPPKTTMKVDKDKYYVREIKAKESGATMTMTVTKIVFGVSDEVFKLNLKDYPNAVVVRK